MEGFGIPDDVLEFLRYFWSARMHDAGVFSAYLLVDENDGRISRQRLERRFSDAMQNCGLESMVMNQYSSFHLLRHSCANRWWALGVPLIDITRKVGHHSVDMTIENYLHVGPHLQKEELDHYGKTKSINLLRKDIAVLLGISERRLGSLLNTPMGENLNTHIDLPKGFSVLSVVNLCAYIYDHKE